MDSSLNQNCWRVAVAAIISVLNVLSVFSQTIVRGNIINAQGTAFVGANVLLLNVKDSALVKGSITDQEGNFFIRSVKPGSYLLATTFTGMRPVYAEPFSINEHTEYFDVGVLRLAETSSVLSNVTIAAKKPLYEQKIDRLVINVASSIASAGSTALDVLERSPGIVVDRFNNAISINGKQGVIILVNGKRNYMDLPSLVQFLSGMPSTVIERIEIITTPPANFDAQGDAGIINIVLKPSNQFGTNGSLSVTGGYSKGEYHFATLNLNHWKGKLNVYGNYSYSRMRMQRFWSSYHAVTNNAGFLEDYSASDRHPLTLQHNGQAGIDYEASKKTVAGLLFTGSYRDWDMNAYNNSVTSTNSVPDTLVNMFNHELHTTGSYGINANLQHTPRTGEKITFNFDYLHYYDNNPNDYDNLYTSASGVYLNSEKMKSGKRTPLHFFIAAIDYEKKVSDKLTWEAGVKQTVSHLTNDVVIATLFQNNWVTDTSLSGFRQLDEKISAAYSSGSMTLTKKTSIKFGLRYEFATSVLGSAVDEKTIDRTYSNLFPSFYFLHTINDNNSVNLSYSRRISRPSFADLAPWVLFSDPKTFQTGNPALLPSISDEINVNYTYKNKILTLSYSHLSNPIINQPALDDKSNRLVNTFTNGKAFESFSASLSLPFTVTKWWKMQYNLWSNRAKTTSFYKQDLQNSFANFYMNATQTFLLPKDISFEIQGWYNTKSGWGLYTIKPMGTVNLGAQKKFEKMRSTLSFNAHNVLNSLQENQNIYRPEQNLVVHNVQRFGYTGYSITFNRRFGKDTVKGKRERLTGAEDEKGRAY